MGCKTTSLTFLSWVAKPQTKFFGKLENTNKNVKNEKIMNVERKLHESLT